jgi:hypothetical protein
LTALRRDGAPTSKARATDDRISTIQGHRIAELRAEALYLDLSALAEGIWEPTQQVLDALVELASRVTWDLAGAA